VTPRETSAADAASTSQVRSSINVPPDLVVGLLGSADENLRALERTLNADLHVIEMTGWNREDWFDTTGLPWVNPSPNIRNLNEALLYPGIAMLESSTNYSVGRGTDAPFEQIGADWIVESGLKPGDRVVVEGAQKVKEGALVNPKPFELEANQAAGQTNSAGQTKPPE